MALETTMSFLKNFLKTKNVDSKYRTLWIMSAILHPTWWYLLGLSPDRLRAPLWEHLAISTVCLTAAGISKWISSSNRHLLLLHGVITWLMTVQYFHHVAISGFDFSHGLILVLIAGCVYASLTSWVEMMAYSVLVSTLSITLWLYHPHIDVLTLFFGLVTLAGINLVACYNRIETIQVLRGREQELRLAHTRTQEILMSIQEGFITCDEDLHITYANPLAIQLLDIENIEVYGKALSEICQLPKGSLIWQTMQNCQKGLGSEFQEKIASNDRWLEFRIYPNHQGLSLFIRDITERKKFEEAMEEQKLKALAFSKLSTLGEMAAGIAHEINNPLAIIQLKAQQLKEIIEDPDSFGPEPIFKAADKIESTTLRIAKIVKALRTLSRDGDNDPFVVAPLKTIVDDALEVCKERFLIHGVELISQCNFDGIELECRPVQISQVVLNLVANAFDSVQRLDAKWVRLELENLSDEIRIHVTDSGSGISSENQQKLFVPFFTTKEIGKGTGLGLSISKSIIDLHGGQLYYDGSCENTRFTIVLPKHRQAQKKLAA